MKTNLTQRRIKAPKRSACGLCKPWKQGGADKHTYPELKAAQAAQEQLDEAQQEGRTPLRKRPS